MPRKSLGRVSRRVGQLLNVALGATVVVLAAMLGAYITGTAVAM
jgi:hypothetical protein